jgi:mutator protein MutT
VTDADERDPCAVAPAAPSPNAPVEVAIALIWKGTDLLITRRPAGVHLADFWEFPGGKRHTGESFERCAEREVLEEVGIVCRAQRTRDTIRHEYAERSVVLVPVDCVWQRGEPQCLGVAAWAWVTPRALSDYSFPEANRALLAALSRGGGRPGSVTG